ncbi:hypothetical protein FRC98_11165 [Lujinxingia vulgaris]|uniref:Lipoprotein n=1 Tax=Lujinxingia vulgaris TaxID=2600176 RepID=A0A5C6XJ54_9DELT|nr:hypothetical protein [Lujinxingia vulgaris]TXD37282.1 hypothetical protein FRC98_11165 [Lujinxingia vulgaris]
MNILPSSLLLSLLAPLLSACTAVPTTPDAPPAPTIERTGTVIQTERRTTAAPVLPAGCTFTQDDPISYILTCGPTLSFLARVQVAEVTPVMVESQEGSVERTLQQAGWTVRRGERVEVTADAGTLGLRHFRAERDDESINAFAGYAPSGPQNHRFFTCFLPDELVPRWPAECATRLRLLRGLANANQVTGLYLQGEPVEIPEGCLLMEKNLRCENNTFTWTEHPSTISRHDLEFHERDFVASFPDALPLPLSCEFLGEPVDCSSWRLDKEGYLPQLVLIAYPTLGDTTLQLTCEAAITDEANQPLPACEPFLKLTREE